MNEKEKETNRDNLDKVIEECPDFTSPAIWSILEMRNLMVETIFLNE